MNDSVVIGAIYEHTRTKKRYKVIALGFHSETLEEMVIYQGLYNDPQFGANPIWTRPKAMFLEKVTVDGEEVPRFHLSATGHSCSS